MFPPAPGLFSMTSCWPRISPTFGLSSRTAMSTGPAGANGTIRWTGFAGQACASAPDAKSRQDSEAAIRVFTRGILYPGLGYSAGVNRGRLDAATKNHPLGPARSRREVQELGQVGPERRDRHA